MNVYAKELPVNNPCQYCEDDNGGTLLSGETYNHDVDIFLYVNHDERENELIANVNNDLFSIEINYCPMCGRKL